METEPSSLRVRASHVSATVGVLLLLGAGFVPADWQATMFFSSIGLMALSQVLVRCDDRFWVWRKGHR